MTMEIVNELTAPEPQREESTLHLLAREWRMWMQGIMVGAGIATVFFMMTIFYAAIVTAAIAVAALIIMMIADQVERRTTKGEELERREVEAEIRAATPVLTEEIEAAKDMPPEVVRRVSWEVVALVSAAALIAVTMGFFLLEWHLVVIGMLVFFFYAILITWPAWLASIELDAEAHTPGNHLSIR